MSKKLFSTKKLTRQSTAPKAPPAPREPLILTPQQQQMADALYPVLQKWGQRAEANIRLNLPFDFLEYQTDLEDAIRPALRQAVYQEIENLVRWQRENVPEVPGEETEAIITALKARYEQQNDVRVEFLVTGLVETTREVLAQGRLSPPDDFFAWQQDWFGAARAEGAAIGGNYQMFLMSILKFFVNLVKKAMNGTQVSDTVDLRWVTMRDDRVRPAHRSLEGAYMDVWSKVYPGGPDSLRNRGCRCVLVPERVPNR